MSESDLLAVPVGPKTAPTLRHNVVVGVLYIEAWLRGHGCVPLFGLMEDAATAEICRTQVWQWIRHGAVLEGASGPLTVAGFNAVLDEEMKKLRAQVGDAAWSAGEYVAAVDLFPHVLHVAPAGRLLDGARVRAPGGGGWWGRVRQDVRRVLKFFDPRLFYFSRVLLWCAAPQHAAFLMRAGGGEGPCLPPPPAALFFVFFFFSVVGGVSTPGASPRFFPHTRQRHVCALSFCPPPGVISQKPLILRCVSLTLTKKLKSHTFPSLASINLIP